MSKPQEIADLLFKLDNAVELYQKKINQMKTKQKSERKRPGWELAYG
jgi:hypothetical protein